MHRVVQPEILDRLPATSDAALCSRRDLRIINRLQGNASWFARQLRECRSVGLPIVELGAGDGDLVRGLRQLAPVVAGLDRIGPPRDWPEDARWFETSVLDFDLWSAYPVVIANLFFHHFDGADLALVGRHVNEHARVILANEPLRTRRTRRLFSLLCPLIRAHPVTRYDGRVSINAGFRGDELAHMLQLCPKTWRWHASETWLGASRLVAIRQP